MKKVLCLDLHPHADTIARKQDVSTAAAQDAVTIRMHLEQIFAAMQTRELLLVTCFVVIRIGHHFGAVVLKSLDEHQRDPRFPDTVAAGRTIYLVDYELDNAAERYPDPRRPVV